MARTRSISSIETEITKFSAELQKAQEKVDDLTQRLLELQEQKLYISEELTIPHGQSDHLSRRFRSLISERDSR